MARRTAKHFKDHLSVFEVGYPIQKGYIARRLLMDSWSVSEVFNEIQSVMQEAEPNKYLHEKSLKRSLYLFKKVILCKKTNLTAEWQSLVKLLIQPYTMPFKNPTVGQASSQPGHMSTLQYPGLSCSSPSEPLLEPDQGPSCSAPPRTLLEPDIQQSIITHSSASLQLPTFPVICVGSSPSKLKRDCKNCVTKQRTNINMLQKNRCLQRQIRDLKMQLREKQRPQFSLIRKNENKTIHTPSASQWQTKYNNLKEKYDDAIATIKFLESLKQDTDSLQTALNYCLDRNKAVVATNHHLIDRLLKSTEKIKSLKKKHDDYKKCVKLNVLGLEQKNRKKVETTDRKIPTMPLLSTQEKNTL